MRLAPVIFLFFLLPPSSAFAQTTPLTFSHLPVDVLRDEGRIWTSPLHLHVSDAKWLLPIAAGAAGLIVTDHAVREDIEEHLGLESPSHRVSKLGSGPALAGASLTLYGLGKIMHNSRATNTGLLAGQAVIHSAIVTAALKRAMNRARPFKSAGGSFWEGGSSFPSGHAAASWSFAAVVAHQYPDKPLVRIGAYGVATAVSLARVGSLDHFPSDVFIGGAIGELIGHFMVRHHDTN